MLGKFLSLNNAGRGKYSCHQPRGTGSPCQVQSIRIFLLEKPLTLSHTRCYFDLHARKVLNLVTMVVELADFTDITQVDQMAICPITVTLFDPPMNLLRMSKWSKISGSVSVDSLYTDNVVQEEALMFAARNPEILNMDQNKVLLSSFAKSFWAKVSH